MMSFKKLSKNFLKSVIRSKQSKADKMNKLVSVQKESLWVQRTYKYKGKKLITKNHKEIDVNHL